MAEAHFDDRMDVDTGLSQVPAFKILIRSLRYIYPVRHLYAAKAFTMTLTLVPYVVAPWPIKIIIDHALLAQPIVPADLVYPPFILSLVSAMAGFSPMEVLLTTLSAVLLVVVLFGFTVFVGGEEGPGALSSFLAEGDDVATRAENQASAGWSLGSGILGYLDLRVQTRLAQTVTHIFRSHLLQRLVRLPMTTLDNNRIGDSMYRVMYDTPSLPRLCFDLTINPLTQLLLASITLLMLSFTYYDRAPELVAIAFAAIPVLFLLTFPFTNLARKASQRARGAGSATTDTIEESMSNISAVQGLGGSGRERERFEADSNASFKQFRFVVLVNVLVDATSALAGAFLLIYGWYIVSDKVIGGTLTPGDYGAVLALFATLLAVLSYTGRLWFNVQHSIAGARRVFFFIDLETESDLGHRTLPPITKNIQLQQVDYAYPDGRKALSGINLDANLGELIAICGPTGAGKTSLAYLIPGFIRPSRGRVLIDGIDIAEVDVGQLRSQIAYVFQENMLFSATVAENIRNGNLAASQASVERAAKLAGAHDFIMELPEGYDTQLGHAGDKISVGQKQRLCIARGLVRDAKILILDEPTSALDPETESRLLEALKSNREGRLVIVIAHRMSTIRAADRIIFMRDGRIVEDGPEQDLMNIPDGEYRRFVELQNGT